MLLVPSIRFRFRFITPRFPVQILCIYTGDPSRQLITAYSHQWNLPRFFRRSGFVSATLLFIVCMSRNTITYDKRWLLMGKSPRLQSPLHASL